MKIERIEIENFQSHKHTEFELDPGVNVIVGPSDVGKSSILRAINWVLSNRPSGDAFISKWKNDGTSVFLDFENGQLERVKDKRFNGYILGMHDEFKGFGLAVPKEIKDFLNINEINVQFQFDSPFMLSWTPGERGVFLNKIVDLEITDRTIGNIKSNILVERRAITLLEEDIKELEGELEEYDNLDQFESDLIKLEKTQEEYETTYKKTIRLARSIAQQKIHRDAIEALSHIPKLLKDVENAESELIDLYHWNKDIVSLKRIINKLQETTKTCESLKDVANFKRSIDKIDIDIDELKTSQENALRLKKLLNQKDLLVYQIEGIETEIKDNKKEFHELMPEECPLCGK